GLTGAAAFSDERTIDQVSIGRRTVSLELPSSRSTIVSGQDRPRGSSSDFEQPEVFSIEATGTKADGTITYTTERVVFEELDSGSLQLVRLSDYLRSHMGEPGVLRGLDASSIVDDGIGI